MIIDCESSDVFCEWIRDYPVFGNVVCWRIDKIAEQQEAISFEFGIHLTAILIVADERMLLTFSGSTGSGESGCKDAEAIRLEADAACESRRIDHGCEPITFRQGKFELF